MKLPRVLVLCGLIDYRAQGTRKTFCNFLALADVTDGEFKGDAREYLAEVVFAPAQLQQGGTVVNDLNTALQAVAKGWEGNPETSWALVLLQLSYECGPINSESGSPIEVDDNFSLKILESLAEKWPDSKYPEKTAIPVVAMGDHGELRARMPRNEWVMHAMTQSHLGVQDYLLTIMDSSGRLRASGGSVPDPSPNPAPTRRFVADLLLRYGLIEGTGFPAVEDSGRVRWVDESVPILGRSRALRNVLREARMAARGNGTCLILGPRGSGKELFARYIHKHSARSKNKYIPFNCSALPEDLAVSMLFGIGPIATGVPPSKGVFREADKGTLFLDEIGDMSPSHQAIVLRVLQEGEVQPPGESMQKVDVRIIAATNKDLEQLATKGEFRRDLLDRLKGFVMYIPPLKERVEDIPLLFDVFLERKTRELKKGQWPKTIGVEVHKILCERRWDGNVRDLEQLALVIASEQETQWYVGPSHIPLETDSAVQETDSQPAVEPQPPSHLEKPPESLSSDEINEVQGALPRMQAAYGRLLERVLSEALDAKRDHTCSKPHPIYGDLVPTSAMKLLLNKPDLKPTDAMRGFHRLGKMLPEAPNPDSDLGKVLRWASGGEKIGRTRSKKDKHGDAHKRQEHVQKH